jgi:galactose mutarotase-like enzyme
MTTRISAFGRLADGRTVSRIVLGSPPGPVLHLLDLGATAHRLEVTGSDGMRRNVLLGHASPADYLASTDYIGGTIGRYANRIAAGRFAIDGKPVSVGAHDRGNHLHGGPDGFDRRLWEIAEHSHEHVVLELLSPDGDQGFPGNLRARATYSVDAGGVRILLEATTDATTVVNLTSHAYFNLDGEDAGAVDEHLLQVSAEEYLPVDPTGIPLGGCVPVAGTPFDLRQPTHVGPSVRSGHEQVAWARGIDHNFALDAGSAPAAVLESPRSGISLRVLTDQPGLQVYTGNFLDGGRRSSTGRLLRQGDGIALEPQLFPDTPNRPEFGSAVLRRGETYRSSITWLLGRS